jgi:hypothetical protein
MRTRRLGAAGPEVSAIGLRAIEYSLISRDIERSILPQCRDLGIAMGALELELSAEEIAELESSLPADTVAGERYPQQGMATLDSERG